MGRRGTFGSIIVAKRKSTRGRNSPADVGPPASRRIPRRGRATMCKAAARVSRAVWMGGGMREAAGDVNGWGPDRAVVPAKDTTPRLSTTSKACDNCNLCVWWSCQTAGLPAYSCATNVWHDASGFAALEMPIVSKFGAGLGVRCHGHICKQSPDRTRAEDGQAPTRIASQSPYSDQMHTRPGCN